MTITGATVYLALGSNLGDRAGNVHAALRAVAAFATVEETSFLYETAAAYTPDQPDFLNAACRIRTRLSPHELLQAIEHVMAELGRRRTVRYGPRLIDIDILFYADLQLESDDLTIPHPRLAERDFVLGPLRDIAPDLVHPTLNESVETLWHRLSHSDLIRVTPIGNRLWSWGRKTYIQGIINVTPDSFSGDGLGQTADLLVERAVAQARRFADEGADCLDVGGHSTRPGHGLLPVSEEIERVVPVIEALAEAVDLPISVDTFRAEIARSAIEVGAHAINDVWGLRFDPSIADIAAEFAVPLMVMHSRLTVDYLDQFAIPPAGAAYDYADIIQDIADELTWSLETALAVGMPRWLLIADPGIGFGKNLAQNLALIDRLGELRSLGYPLLGSPSRKGFIGKALGGLPPEQRLEGTIAACVLAIDRGADILRVHDVKAVARAARIADAIVDPDVNATGR
jgi:dihydropteroate synthase/2-amino-4-hydroxy-6-hydroxymethyldihydropteridine diphosphokinase